VHYAMPVRNMLYDALQYAGQVEETARKHNKDKDHNGRNAGEYLSGFYRDDRLVPVITLVVLFNADEWDGPLSIHEMVNVEKPELLELIQNYRINLICPAQIKPEELNRFDSSLKQVMSFIKYSKDKAEMQKLLERDESFRNVDRKAANVMRVCTGLKVELEEENEVTDMCKAWEDMMADCRMEGREEGRECLLAELVIKKIQRGKSVTEIADEVEETVEVVQKIIEAQHIFL
ncbi:MAG: transposase, partial [Wujia sp.]